MAGLARYPDRFSISAPVPSTDLKKNHGITVETKEQPACDHDHEPQSPGSRPRPVGFVRSVPWVGLIALVYSALSVLISFGVLEAIQGHKVWQGHIKPASLLSVILSSTSIALHVALSAGVNIAWWHRATKDGATAGDLHEAWQQGTSVVSALSSGKKFTYIAMASIFVATIPLNGLMLQSTIAQEPFTRYFSEYMQAPLVESWSEGYSAAMNSDGTVGLIKPEFNEIIALWQNFIADPDALTTPIITGSHTFFEVSPYNNTAYFSANGVGLYPTTCTSYTEVMNLNPKDYDFAPNSSSYRERIYETGFSWSQEEPNTIFLNMKFREPADADNYWTSSDGSEETNGCLGNYTTINCTLEAYTMEYPIMLTYSSKYEYPAILLDPTTNYTYDKPIRPVEKYNEIGGNTTYGGLADVLGRVMNSSIDIEYDSGNWSLFRNGPFSLSLQPLRNSLTEGWNTLGGEYCNIVYEFTNSDGGNDLKGGLLESIRSLMFLSSVNIWLNEFAYGMLNDGSFVIPDAQNVTGTRVEDLNIYKINWQYYFGSLAVTLAIALVIFPTFWGFWRLPRKTTLSPLETARAFKAPLVHEVSEEDDVKALLDNVGHKNVHRDFQTQYSDRV